MEDKEKKEQENPNNSPKGKIINKIDMKSYRVPDASNKKGFEKINNFNFIKISKFLSFLEIAEASFVNKKFNNLLTQRYSKRFPAIKTSISIFNKSIFIKFPEDFRFYLEKNRFHIKEIIKKIIESLHTEEYFNKLSNGIFTSKLNGNIWPSCVWPERSKSTPALSNSFKAGIALSIIVRAKISKLSAFVASKPALLWLLQGLRL